MENSIYAELPAELKRVELGEPIMWSEQEYISAPSNVYALCECLDCRLKVFDELKYLNAANTFAYLEK